MRILIIIGLALAVTGPVTAQEVRQWPRYLIELQDKADELCRGTSTSSQTDDLCQVRDDLARRLLARGVCYGQRGQISAEMRWHWCNANSQQRQPR
jgi:hypothetical protein